MKHSLWNGGRDFTSPHTITTKSWPRAGSAAAIRCAISLQRRGSAEDPTTAIVRPGLPASSDWRDADRHLMTQAPTSDDSGTHM